MGTFLFSSLLYLPSRLSPCLVFILHSKFKVLGMTSGSNISNQPDFCVVITLSQKCCLEGTIVQWKSCCLKCSIPSTYMRKKNKKIQSLIFCSSQDRGENIPEEALRMWWHQGGDVLTLFVRGTPSCRDPFATSRRHMVCVAGKLRLGEPWGGRLGFSKHLQILKELSPKLFGMEHTKQSVGEFGFSEVRTSKGFHWGCLVWPTVFWCMKGSSCYNMLAWTCPLTYMSLPFSGSTGGG